jgi:ketosteroid isomerase-like protein
MALADEPEEDRMMTVEFAANFAREWVDAWNSHDLERVLAHYRDDFEMSSPYIPRIAGEPSGTLKGKAIVRAYWAKALQRVPDLRFELIETLRGVDSVVISYRGTSGTAAEVFFFDAHGKVAKAFAHYAQQV